MRIAASPLVVAVALGLLGPAALMPDAEEAESASPDKEGDEALAGTPALRTAPPPEARVWTTED